MSNYVSKFIIDDSEVYVKDTESRNSINSLTSNVSNLSANVATNTNSINSINGSVNSLNNSVETLSSDVATANTQLATLSSRMDGFASLPSGSTSGNAELLDIRVAYDGKTYASAGDAVRGQIDDLVEDINCNGYYEQALINETNIYTRPSTYISYTGTDNTNVAYASSNYIPVRAGDKIYYKSLWGSQSVCTIAFYNSARQFDSSNSVRGTGLYQVGTFTVPSDGYVRFCNSTQYLSDVTIFFDGDYRIKGYLHNSIFNEILLKTKGRDADSLGDSITYQSYLSASDRWQTRLTTMLQLNSFGNHGVDMSTVADLAGRNGMCTDARINAIPQGLFLLTVMGGMNDWASNVPIGNEDYNNVDTSTFFGACNVMFRKILTRLPGSRVVAFGTTFGYLNDRDNFTDKTGYKNNQGLCALDYSTAMMKSAQLNGVEHYDLGGNLGISDSNKGVYLMSENAGKTYIHPNANGAYRIAQMMAKFIGHE